MGKQRDLVDTEKNMERQPEQIRTMRGEVERSQALKLPSFSLLSGSNSCPPFLKSQAKTDSNIFCLQFNSTLFPFKSLHACFLSLPGWRGEVATGDERHLRGQTNMRISEPSRISSETSIACWVQWAGHCVKP